MINHITVVGRLTRKPELKMISETNSVSALSIAVNETRYNKTTKEKTERVHFFDVASFGHTAKFVCQYADKGTLIAIEGKLEHQTWTAKDGSKASKVIINAEHIEIMQNAQNGTNWSSGGNKPEVMTAHETDLPF